MDYIFHIPTVTPKELEGEDKTSMDVQGVSQTATPEFAIEGTNNNNEKVKITPDFDYLSKLVDPTTGNVINDPVLTVEGKEIYLLSWLYRLPLYQTQDLLGLPRV